jgi:hypothetical protein
MIPAAAIVANAIEDAVGVRINTMPITAEKLALVLLGIPYERVRGPYMGFGFSGKLDGYTFRIGAASVAEHREPREKSRLRNLRSRRFT